MIIEQLLTEISAIKVVTLTVGHPVEHQMSLRGKFVCTSLRWRLSLIYPASLFEIWKATRHLLDMRLALFFGPLAHAPSDVGLDQGNHCY